MSNTRIDRLSERITRRIASRSSRRSFLSRLGMALVSAPVLPLLPVARAGAQTPSASAESPSEFAPHAQTKDEKLCTYWRYCAMSGDPCSCSGGGLHTCPAGALPSPTAWIGTCVNPGDDKKSYLIAYHDCCGKHSAEPGEDCDCNATDPRAAGLPAAGGSRRHLVFRAALIHLPLLGGTGRRSEASAGAAQ